MDQKECRKCGEIKSVTGFGRQAKSKDGLKNYCKQCISAMNRERYQKNKEKHKAQVRKWQEENRDKVLEYKKRYSKRRRSG